MALDGHLHKLVFGGTLCGVESWSCSLHFIKATPGVLDPTNIVSALEQWWLRSETFISSGANLDFVKYNEVSPTTGDYLDASGSNTYYWTPPAPKPGNASPGDPAGSVCVSLVTAVKRGYAHAGRFFPPTAAYPQADGKILTGAAQGMATSAAQLITDLNGSNTGEVYVWSQRGQVQHQVVACRVGRVVDHQSRRRKNLTEDYQITPVS